MADSFLRGKEDFVTLFPGNEDTGVSQSPENDRSLKLLMPFLIIMFAFFLAPESPQQLASICERHNPEIACRVW